MLSQSHIFVGDKREDRATLLSIIHLFASKHSTMRDALILLPVSLAVLAGIWKVDDLMIGASGDFVRRWVPLYVVAWFLAWLIMILVMSARGLRDRDFSHFTRCVVAVLLVWPVLAVTTSIAEEWTIAHRIATWTEPSDMGYRYLYWEMSGMGYARGWAEVPRRFVSYTLLGVMASVAWVPVLLLSLFVWSRTIKPSGIEAK
jgi:hypothetical protein